MRTVKIYLENLPGSPYSQSARHEQPKLDRESHEDYEARTWRQKCTINRDGQVAIPLMGLKKAIDTAAFKLAVKVPGRKTSFKNFFVSGYVVDHDIPLSNGKPLTPDDAECVTIFSDVSGKPGGTRVARKFPVFHKWAGTAEVTIIDDVITEQIFEHHVASAGMIVGIGRFRPENGGGNGRFRVVKYEWNK